MKGIELSRKYYETFGKPMLEDRFGDVLPLLAVGFVGSGSDRYGFDDDISHDHDFEPGFCIFMPDEDVLDRRTEFLLARAYAKLPREFEGFLRSHEAPVGGNRNGAIRTSEFYSEKVGSKTGVLTLEQWIRIPDYALADATNGEVFYDGYGEFSRIRNALLDMPEDVRLKKLAGNVLIMAQSGQYNYTRCLAHGEPEAAQLALNSFVEAALGTFFLLNKTHMPFYKWAFRAAKKLNGGERFAEKISSLMCGDLFDAHACELKHKTAEDICCDVIELLKSQGLTAAASGDLERHAYSVNDGIKDAGLRNANIFAAV